MIIQRFLQWIHHAPEGARAEASGALARAYLYSDLNPQEIDDAEAALTLLTEDDSIMVRHALVDALAPSSKTPHHIVLALARDIEAVAICMVGLSPVLTDADLIDLALDGKPAILLAIAHREYLSPGVVAALAELGDDEVCQLLLDKPHIMITPSVMARMAERFGHLSAIAEALLQRSDLPVTVRQTLMVKMSAAIATVIVGKERKDGLHLPGMVRDVCDRATLALATEETCDLTVLVEHICQTGQLTPVFVLRTLLSGNIPLFEETLARLSGLTVGRISGLVHDASQRGFAALYMKTGLPLSAYHAFAAALKAWHEVGLPSHVGVALQRQMVEKALDACQQHQHDGLDALLGVLRQFADEAMREEALQKAAKLREAQLPPELQPQPEEKLLEYAA